MTETDNPPVVYKVIGPPGSGKTTRVVGNPDLPDVTSLVMENLEEYPLEEQMIVTYTNAGVDEAADRLERILDSPRYRIDERVLTIHAHCYRALGINKDQVVRWWHERNFCQDNDMVYGNSSDDGDIMSQDQDEGHAFFDIYNWLKSNWKGITEWQDCPAEFPSEKDFVEMADKWEAYKDQEDLIEFSDMIEQTVIKGQILLHDAGHPNIFGDQPTDPMETFEKTRDLDRFDQEKWRGRGPFVDTRVLYVDEVQDLTPLQWRWYLMQKLVCEKVYIGGDDDQTIYGWAGANPNFMLDEEGDFEVLPKTYRIPSNIWEACDGVIQQVDKRQPKTVVPHGEGGTVETLRSPSPRQLMQYLEEGECFVLFRARYMIDEFREQLHAYGIPYRNQTTFDTWSDDVELIRDGLSKLEAGEDKLTSQEVEALVEHAYRECPNCNGDGCHNCAGEGEESFMSDDNGFDKTEQALGNLGGIRAERVREIFDLTHRYNKRGNLNARNYLNQTSKLNYYEKEAIRGNITRGNEHMKPERVRIGTIHSAKGKEAETVVLALDSTQRILENMLQDTKNREDKVINDAERRVYYVGMSRASETLVLAQGIFDAQNTIRLKDLLADYEDLDDRWAVGDPNLDSRE